MDKEDILLAAAAATAVGLVVWRIHSNSTAQAVEQATSVAPVSELPESYEGQLVNGPSYYVASAPYYFSPPVSNVMPQAVASRTIPSGDWGCGCG